jgi:thymidylate kinase
MSTSNETTPVLLEQVADALDARGVRWSVLRGGSDLGNLERDVDLLVAREDLAAFGETVVQLGGVPLPAWLQGWHRFYWFPPPTRRQPGLTLDVVTELTYGRGAQLPTGLASGCLERRVRSGLAYELAPTDAFWTVILHCLLDKGEVKERRARELEAALPGLVRPSEAESLVAGVCPQGWSPDRLIDSVRRGDWVALNAVAAALRPDDDETRKSTKRRTAPGVSETLSVIKRRLPSRNSAWGNVAKASYALAWRMTSNRSGGPEATQVKGNAMRSTEIKTVVDEQTGSRAVKPFRISLSGLDGSGKSRQTAALAAALGQDHDTELVWVPFDIWPGSMLKLLPTRVRVMLGPRGRMDADAQLTAAQLADRAAAAEEKAAHPQQVGLALRVFWWTVASLAAVSAGTSLRRRMNRMTTEVVVVDRYRFDTIVKLQTWYPTVSPTWLARIVLKLAPAPDVECLLRVEGTEAYARKPEQYNAVQLTHQARRYDDLVAYVPGAVAVDGQAAPEDVTLELTRLANAALHAR